MSLNRCEEPPPPALVRAHPGERETNRTSSAKISRRNVPKYWTSVIFIAYWLVLALVTTALYRRAFRCKTVLLAGSASVALAVILFGLLEFVPCNTGFVFLAVLLRCIEGAGCAMFHDASENYIRFHFENKRSMYLGANQSLYYFGFVFGPIVGGMIYSDGSFYYPFFAAGGSVIVCFVTLTFVVDKHCLEDRLTVSTLSYTAPFKLSKFLFVVVPYTCQGFNLCTLWFLLDGSLKLPPLAIGGLVALPDIASCLMTPVFAPFVTPDSCLPMSLIYAIGSALTSASVYLLGPGYPTSRVFPTSAPHASFCLFGLGVGQALLLLAPRVTEAGALRAFDAAFSLVSVWAFIGSILGACLSIPANGILDLHLGFTITSALSAALGTVGVVSFLAKN
ncbi:MFS-type transporter SLC18B1 [Galendromus occidentalis]|uniref:MFS-type transporter SLC18B1 n=1 Tax=Galendromus occidentalis TaxID=34638 RepID=A0AAJ6QMI2_9ACAR|nr:MFS-type transporter SLC18B1 [Galendromus occidentalis]